MPFKELVFRKVMGLGFIGLLAGYLGWVLIHGWKHGVLPLRGPKPARREEQEVGFWCLYFLYAVLLILLCGVIVYGAWHFRDPIRD